MQSVGSRGVGGSVGVTLWTAVPRLPGYLHIPHSPTSKLNCWNQVFCHIRVGPDRVSGGNTFDVKSPFCYLRGGFVLQGYLAHQKLPLP